MGLLVFFNPEVLVDAGCIACVQKAWLVFMRSGVCSFGMAHNYYAQHMCMGQDLNSLGTAFVHQVWLIVFRGGLYVCGLHFHLDKRYH